MPTPALFPPAYDHEFVIAVLAQLLEERNDLQSFRFVTFRIFYIVRHEYVVYRRDVAAVLKWLLRRHGFTKLEDVIDDVEPLLVEMRRAILHEMLFESAAETG